MRVHDDDTGPTCSSRDRNCVTDFRLKTRTIMDRDVSMLWRDLRDNQRGGLLAGRVMIDDPMLAGILDLSKPGGRCL